ncbi:MAG: lactate utilization protein [Chitinophagaceae bacterium]
MSNAKDNILEKIRKALEVPVPLPFPEAEQAVSVFKPPHDDLAVIFAEEFTRLQGKFAFFSNHDELVKQIKALIAQKGWKEVYCVEDGLRYLLKKNGFEAFSEKPLAESDVALTTCEMLVARTGTMVMSAAQPSGRTTSVYAPVHICIAEASQVVYELDEAIQLMKEKYGIHLPSLITFATGPSRTADIEKTLVVGVHGPKEVYCLLADQ